MPHKFEIPTWNTSILPDPGVLSFQVEFVDGSDGRHIFSFTKPSLFQRNRPTSGGNPTFNMYEEGKKQVEGNSGVLRILCLNV